jgi:hypothetical protein
MSAAAPSTTRSCVGVPNSLLSVPLPMITWRELVEMLLSPNHVPQCSRPTGLGVSLGGHVRATMSGRGWAKAYEAC